MKKYQAYVFQVPDEDIADIFSAFLSEEGFEGFHYHDEELIAYIASDALNPENFKEILKLLEGIHPFTWTSQEVEDQNWNKIWESNYEPVLIDDDTVIRAPFHQEFPDRKYRITLSPKMSFGTGHHPSTRLMIKMMKGISFEGKRVLDAGCGTGVLAIFAEMLGSTAIFAFDNFIYAYQNTLENVEINNCAAIETGHLELSDIAPEQNQFDIVLANINRNVIMENMARLIALVKPGGTILFSGIMENDSQMIELEAQKLGLSINAVMPENGWVSISCNK